MERKLIMKIFIFAITLFLITSGISAQVSENWARTFNGPGNGHDSPQCIGSDSSANVYVSGLCRGIGTQQYNLVTVKYNTAGVLQWVNIFNGPGINDQPQKMIVDATGNCYIAGFSISDTTVNAIVLKIAPDGNQVWVNTVTNGSFNAIAFDNNGNIIATGNTNDSILVVKYNIVGNQQWLERLGVTNYNVTTSSFVSTDHSNNIYLAGECDNHSTETTDALLYKLGPNGNVIWDVIYNSPLNSYDHFSSIAVSNSGNIYTTLESDSMNFAIGFVNKYNQNGTLLWSKHTTSMGTVGLDRFENVFVGGNVGTIGIGTHGPGVIKYDRNGNLIWQVFHNVNGVNEFFSDFKIDACSNLYVLGNRTQSDSVSYSVTTKYNSNGVQKWSINKNGNLFDTTVTSISSALSLTNQKDVFTMMSGMGRMSLDDYITVKYDQLFHSVTGLVTYSDNNQPVTTGWAKALYYDISSSGIIVVDSAAIQSDGHYTLQHVPEDTLDIMFYQNDDELDFVPTYYVSTVDWRQASKIYATGNLSNINCQVYRINNTTNPFSIGGMATCNSDQGQAPIGDAIIYVQTGNLYKNYGISNGSGTYAADKLAPGSYTLTAFRMGFNPVSQNVTITNGNVQNINFNFGSPIGIQPISSQIPSKFNLYQNYPNPFNPETVIKFDVPKDQRVKIVIYDITGREVNKLLNEEVKAGTYNVRWNGSNYASGVYFYRIETESYTLTKKMLLVK